MVTLKQITEQFENYSSITDRKFEIIEGRLDGLKIELIKSMNEIKTNHLAHMKEQIINNSNDLEWIKKIQWYGIATSTGAMVGIITKIIIDII